MQVLCFFDPAILHPQHPVCLRRKPLVVGDIHNGLVLLCGCLPQQAEYLHAVLVVQVAGRLVCQHDRRAGDQCPGNGGALLLPAGKLGGLALQQRGQPQLPGKQGKVFLVRLPFVQQQRQQEQMLAEAVAEPKEDPKPADTPKQPKAVKSEQGIIVEGLDNCLVKFSKCCTPVPGDDIVGFITRGYGVSVHRADCPNASEEKRKEQPDRWIHVSWGTDTNDSYPTTIEAVCKDRLNLLLDISSALSTTKTFVLGLNTRSTEDGFAIIRIEIQIKDGAQLSTLMNKLHQISGVLQVNRPVG